MKNLSLNKKLGLGVALITTASLASAGPVATMAAAIDMGDVLTAVGAIGVGVLGVVLAIKAIKFLKSAI